MGACDPILEGHASRVAAHAETVARRLGWPDEKIEDAPSRRRVARRRQGERRPEVLGKPGRLDDGELAEVRAHPVEGAWLIAGVRSLVPALPYVLFHHERWDGSGLSDARAGIEIPLEGRILAVADAFDAMTSARPYRDALRVRRCGGGGRALRRHAVRPRDRRRVLRGVAAGEIVGRGTALRRGLRQLDVQARHRAAIAYAGCKSCRTGFASPKLSPKISGEQLSHSTLCRAYSSASTERNDRGEKDDSRVRQLRCGGRGRPRRRHARDVHGCAAWSQGGRSL